MQHENWKIGDEIEISAPEGTICYEPMRDEKHIVGIAGGSGDTYLGKNKNKGLDAKLALATKWVGGVFIVLTLGRNEHRLPALLAMGSLGALVGATAYVQWGYLFAACRDLTEWIVLGGITLLGIAALLNLPTLITRGQNKLSHSLLFVLILAGLVTSFLLITKMSFIPRNVELHPMVGHIIYLIDGRYRDFPLPLYALPALQYAIGFSLLGLLQRSSFGRYRRLNSAAMMMAAICLILEPLNTHALLWLGIIALLAYASWPRKGARI